MKNLNNRGGGDVMAYKQGNRRKEETREKEPGGWRRSFSQHAKKLLFKTFRVNNKERGKENRADKRQHSKHRRAAKGYAATPYYKPGICNNKNTRQSLKTRSTTLKEGGREGLKGGLGESRTSTVTHSPALDGFPYYNMACLLDVSNTKY